MRLTKRSLSVVVLAGLVLPLGAQYSSPTRAASTCASRIGLNVSGSSGANQEGDIVRHELDMFMKANPCITTFFRPIPTTYEQKIQTEFASGDEPDVMYVSPPMIYNEGKAGKLLDLNKYLAKDGVKTSAYIPALLKVFQLNGHTYGLPKDWGTLGVFYNKAIFDAKHIAYPSNNLTYDQYRTLAMQLYTPSSNPSKVVYGTMMPEDNGRFMTFLYGFGSTIMDPVTGKIGFNNANAIKALDYYTSFQLTDHSSTIPATVGDGWQGDSFGKGKVAMVLEGGWLTPYLHNTYPKIRFGVAQIPVGPAGRADPVFTNAWGASVNTVKAGTAAAAAKLIEFLTGPVVQKYQTDIGFALPTLPALQSDPYLKTHPEASNLFNSYTSGKLGSFGAYDSITNKALGDAITKVILGKQTAAQAIPAAAKTLQSQITAVP
ncbi:MAG: extracellular solute-binding protein family 1 [Chloroflexi bacterium]|nr:extracellular solute-binding protein family 1 [Chloroflexota bacterium]